MATGTPLRGNSPFLKERLSFLLGIESVECCSTASRTHDSSLLLRREAIGVCRYVSNRHWHRQRGVFRRAAREQKRRKKNFIITAYCNPRCLL